jgi:two-component system CheB/CheR fusion protein
MEHRRLTRGLLATIRAIVRRTARPELSAEEFAAQLEGRLGALGRVQDMLMRVPDAGADLMELISAEFLAQAIPDERVNIQGPTVALSGKVAASLALSVHELANNAIKFGALSCTEGRIGVQWSNAGADGYTRFEWREERAPILTAAPRVAGFGHELLQKTLPYELGAQTTLDFAPGGLICVIEFLPAGSRGSQR